MPRVSVIIPAFNAEAHLAETLASVHGQTYGDWEVVLADDASTDRTAEVAAGFGERIRIAYNPESQGPAAARNLAIGQATGELLAFLDADDYWLPEYLERQVGLFDASKAQHRKIGVVACDARVLTPTGFLARTYLELVKAPREVTLTMLLRSNPIFVSALAPRAVVDEAGGFCEDIVGTEDHDLWVRIVELGYRVLSNPTPLAVYRVTPGSVSADTASMARAEQKVLTRALGRGNLARRERRVASRELRLLQAVELLTSGGGAAWQRVARALPQLVVVVAENPRRWAPFVKRVVRGRGAFHRLGV